MTAELWDCFYVNDELDLVELRFGLLERVVDRFVVVEAGLTFSGVPKTLNFHENIERFARWRDRIDHVVADLPVAAADAWEREYAQRSTLRDHLRRTASSDTLLLVGDVDEFPDPTWLAQLKEVGLERSVRLGMRHANYYANWVMKTEWDLGPMAFTTAMLADRPVAHLLGDRSLNDDSRLGDRVSGTGWHFSFLGGPEKMRSKLRAYSHQDFATEVNLRPGHLERCMRWGSTITGYHVLRKQPRTELDALQEFVLAQHPEWFRFDQRSTPVRAHAYNAYSSRLLSRSINPFLGGFLQRHPGSITTGLLPYFLALDTLRRLRDRFARSRSSPM